MDSSPSWKSLKKRYYTALYVIEIKGWIFAEIQDGREMLKVAQGATKLILLSYLYKIHFHKKGLQL